MEKTIYVLDETKRNYRELQESSKEEIKIISCKIKSAIELAKPFYEARKQANEYLKELKVEQVNHEKAKNNLAAAKEMVFLAENTAVSQVMQEKFCYFHFFLIFKSLHFQ